MISSAADQRDGVRTGRRPPSYRALADDLRARIRAVAAGESTRLPTEAELTAEHGVSRGTVRRAYADLVAEGLVHRVPGRGSFSVPPAPYRRSFNSVDELLALSEDTTLELVSPLRTIGDVEAAGALGLQFDDVLHLAYRRCHESQPFCFTEVFLPPRLLPYLESASFLRQPLARSRETVLGILDRALPTPVAGSKQTITAISVPPGVAAQIALEEGAPVLRIERVHFDVDGRPVERCVNYFNPDRYVYRLQLSRH